MQDQIEQAILAKLPNARVSVSTFDGVHFSAEIYCASLTGKTRVMQHQEIYQALTDRFGANWSETIHALEIKIVKE